jgi:hypothetical protein
MTWQLAMQTCKNLNLGGRVWRLPNINELYTLVDYNNSSNSINTLVFPNPSDSFHWSSTTQVNSINNAWRVTFFSGGISSNSKLNVHYVRCVSGP